MDKASVFSMNRLVSSTGRSARTISKCANYQKVLVCKKYQQEYKKQYQQQYYPQGYY